MFVQIECFITSNLYTVTYLPIFRGASIKSVVHFFLLIICSNSHHFIWKCHEEYKYVGEWNLESENKSSFQNIWFHTNKTKYFYTKLVSIICKSLIFFWGRLCFKNEVYVLLHSSCCHNLHGLVNLVNFTRLKSTS